MFPTLRDALMKHLQHVYLLSEAVVDIAVTIHNLKIIELWAAL